MRRTTLLLVTAIAACGSPATSHEPGPRAALPDARAARFPALAGAWRGAADTADYGRVTATLFVSDDGMAHATVTAKGHVVVRRFRIESWNGEILHAEGVRVRAVIRGEALVVELPQLGEVTFTR